MRTAAKKLEMLILAVPVMALVTGLMETRVLMLTRERANSKSTTSRIDHPMPIADERQYSQQSDEECHGKKLLVCNDKRSNSHTEDESMRSTWEEPVEEHQLEEEIA